LRFDPTARLQNVEGSTVKICWRYEVMAPGAEKCPIFLMLIVFGDVGLAEGW
jgi:hypothetical protein